MSGASSSSSGRVRRREGDDEQQDAEPLQPQSAAQTYADDAAGANTAESAAAGHSQSADVEPLPEQFSQRKKQRQSPCLNSPLDLLADVELQLCLQFLDLRSKLKAARCSQRTLQSASAPFAWRAGAPFTVEVQSAADVQRIGTSLLRFAPVQLRCVGIKSLLSVAAVPRLVGLELLHSPAAVTAADLPQLLQHPNLARLQVLRLDYDASEPLTVDTMRLVARLPELCTFDAFVPISTKDAALLQPLAGAPALTDLALDFIDWTSADLALIRAIGGCAGLRRLRLGNLTFRSGTFLALCSSPSMRRLRHLELVNCIAITGLDDDVELPNAGRYQPAFSALEKLQSLTLENVVEIDALLLHLHRAPALRRLSIRCEPDYMGIENGDSPLPTRAVLSALLAPPRCSRFDC